MKLNVMNAVEEGTSEVVAIGNINLDLILFVNKLAGMDEKAEILELYQMPGGSASNYAVGLARLGVKVSFAGFIGDDETGRWILEEMKREGIDVSMVRVAQGYNTGRAISINSKGGGHVLYSYRGANSLLEGVDVDSRIVGRTLLYHLSSIGLNMLESACNYRVQTDSLLSIDPGPRALGHPSALKLLKNADILYLNSVEFERLCERKAGRETVLELADELDSVVCVKLGEQGVIASDGDDVWEVGAFKTEPVDTTGAGDAYASAFTYGILKGLSIEECCVLGNAMASLKIRKIGGWAGMPDKEQLSRFLDKHGFKDLALRLL